MVNSTPFRALAIASRQQSRSKLSVRSKGISGSTFCGDRVLHAAQTHFHQEAPSPSLSPSPLPTLSLLRPSAASSDSIIICPSYFRSFTTNNNNNQENSSESPKKLTIKEKKDDNDDDEEDFGKFPMPNKEKEEKLKVYQSRIQGEYKKGNYKIAKDICLELIDATTDHFGLDHPVTASSYNNLALMYKQLGKYKDAYANYNQARRIYGKVVGRDHMSYAMTLHNLANLNKAQVHFDADLSQLNRLTLMETACQYLQEAYEIYKNELGVDHPNTVSAQSTLGSTLAAQVLHYHKHVVLNNSNNSKIAKRQNIPLMSKSQSQQQWEAAETHLRKAMDTAVAKPRGTQKLTKHQKQKYSKSPKKVLKIETLSAAMAAQNLAIVLKARAITETPYNEYQMKEAQDLYEQVIFVQSQLLPTNHPDIYASKYSLAELLETIGNDEDANVLRQEILDTYEPSEDVDSNKDEEEQATGEPKIPPVKIEQTKAVKD